MNYEKPIMELVIFQENDIIRTSGDLELGDNDHNFGS